MTGRLLAIGDIHGCNRKLQRLLAQIDLDPDADRLVFIGDYIDRGPDIRGVIETIIALKETCPNVVCLRGNHEDMFINYFLEGRDEELFFANDGGTTLSSYGLTLADARSGRGFPEDHLRFLASLPLSYETEAYFFVHAGLRPGISLAGQSPEDFLWIRHEFIDSEYNFCKTVVFGHTPIYRPLFEKNKIGIDTGAVYGGHLTCIELPSLKIHQA